MGSTMKGFTKTNTKSETNSIGRRANNVKDGDGTRGQLFVVTLVYTITAPFATDHISGVRGMQKL